MKNLLLLILTILIAYTIINMAEKRFPQQISPSWTQPNLGEFLGDLYGTYNMNISSIQGKIFPSSTVIKAKSEDDDAQLTTPVAFVRTSAAVHKNRDSSGNTNYTIQFSEEWNKRS
jgi:hypothetical protein